MTNTKQAAHPFLMFTGRAEEAMNLYTSLFTDSGIVSLKRYGKEDPGQEGKVWNAVFTIKGLEVMAFDSAPVHPFDFTPSMSLFVRCGTEAELDRAFTALSDGGKVMMPPANYGFSDKFTWVSDRFGVSWQLNLGDVKRG